MQQHDHNDQQQGGPPFKELRQQIGIFHGLAEIVSAPAELLMRKGGTMGERYIGFHAGAGLLVMIAAPILCFPKEDPVPLVIAWVLALGVMIGHRIKGYWLRKYRGQVTHSLYSGESIFARLGEEIWVKQHVEPFVLIAGGIGMCFFSPPLGAWMIVAGICHGFCVAWSAERDAARVRAMKDARIEQEIATDRFRQEGGA